VQSNSSYLLSTLENIIAPGGKFRLSPYIEATQIDVLFGEKLSAANRVQGVRKVITDQQEAIRILAKKWYEEYQRRSQNPINIHESRTLLNAYLIYDFSINIAKIQLMMLDLVRAGKINQELKILDIGEETGITHIAILDFLISWKTICDLYDASFPLTTITLQGLESNPTSMEYSRKILHAYRDVLELRGANTSNELFQLTNQAINTAEWHLHDINQTNFQFFPSANFIIIDGLLASLSSVGKTNLRNLLTNIPNNALALIIEPGHKEAAIELMLWRHQFLSNTHWKTGPCGDKLAPISEACNQCWNSRRLSLHEPELFTRFKEMVIEEYPADEEGLLRAESDLLSWSAVWIVNQEAEKPNSNPLLDDAEIWPESIPLRFIGKYLGGKDVHTGPAHYDPDVISVSSDVSWKEYLKFCPSITNTSAMTMIRDPGFQIPDLRHGELVRIEQGSISRINTNYWEISVSAESQIERVETRSQVLSFFDRYSDKTRQAVDEIGYRLFGFPSMHNFQHQIISRVLSGKSILGIAATGSGKSECFILPAMLLSGLTVVVSPLVSLMMDQYDQRIHERYGLGQVTTFINGEVPFSERRARLKRMELGYYKLVYFTPEQLERSYILDSLRRANEKIGVRYLAMDEAHCISQWGHDFRPSYLNLIRRFAAFEMDPVRIALTATASPNVRDDICDELKLNKDLIDLGGDVYVESSNRPELNLIVKVHRNLDDKASDIVDDLESFIFENKQDKQPGAAIIFMPHTGGNPDNARNTESTPRKGRLSAGVSRFAAHLEKELQTRVSIYHGKMELDEPDTIEETNQPKSLGDLSGRCRRSEQSSFIKNQTDIMVATKGFGMGIDKDNVRLIIHRTPTSNLEAYAQESGRAGRDGAISNVILHYSPDHIRDDEIKVQSDFEIQEFFISNKYVREQDTRVMLAFLKQVSISAGKNLYFTNDQAIEFFDRCALTPSIANLREPYQWPEFDRRAEKGRESTDHKFILDKGWIYQQKTSYINRILQVLYRIRPSIAERKRITFLEQVHQTGTEIIQPNVIDIEGIFHSNTYFGELFRVKNINQKDLSNLLLETNLVTIANQLDMEIHETAGLLYDIKNAAGTFSNSNKWIPYLYDFKFIAAPKLGPASGRSTMDAWRDYAGAYERATTPEAYRRARAAGRGKKEYEYNGKIKTTQDTSLDDWFSWNELNSSKGWELQPGDAFHDDVNFQIFLNAFIKLHDERQKNDWASYHRLLTEYVGVEKDGRISNGKKDGECLRSVLLGYLETYEVVDGESCFGCSRCVPNLNFGRYSIEQRKAVIVRIPPSFAELLDELKIYSEKAPSDSDIERLFTMMSAEEQAGRSVKGYISGWTARLMDQVPNHIAAMWIRTIAMWDGIFPLQVHEMIENHLKFINQLDVDLMRLPSLTHEPIEGLTESGGWYQILAQANEHFGDHNKAFQYSLQAMNLFSEQPAEHREQISEVASNILRLGEEKGYEIASEIRTAMARTANDYDISFQNYASLVPEWQITDVEQEIGAQINYQCSAVHQAALILAWAKIDSENLHEAIRIITEQIDDFELWPKDAIRFFISHLPLDLIVTSNVLVDCALQLEDDVEQVVTIGIQSLEKGIDLSAEAYDKISEYLLLKVSNSPNFLLNKYPDSNDLVAFLEIISENLELSSQEEFLNWLKLYPRNISLSIKKNLLEKGITLLGDNAELIISALRELAFNLLSSEKYGSEVLRIWSQVWMNVASELDRLLCQLSSLGEIGQKLGDEAFELLIKSGSVEVLKEPIKTKYSRWINGREFVKRAYVLKYLIHDWQNISSRDLHDICNAFVWRDDVEQADMLAVILDRMILGLNPNWKTPIARLVEVLVAGKRFENAKEVAIIHEDLRIRIKAGNVSAEEFIEKQALGGRDVPISKDYVQLSKMILFSSIDDRV